MYPGGHRLPATATARRLAFLQNVARVKFNHTQNGHPSPLYLSCSLEMAAHLLKQNICNTRKSPEVTCTDCVLQRTNSTKRQTRLLFWARAGHSSAEIILDCSEKHSENTQLYTLHYSFQASHTIPFNIPKKKKTPRPAWRTVRTDSWQWGTKKIALQRLVYETFTLCKKTLTLMYTDSSCTKSTPGMRACSRFLYKLLRWYTCFVRATSRVRETGCFVLSSLCVSTPALQLR